MEKIALIFWGLWRLGAGGENLSERAMAATEASRSARTRRGRRADPGAGFSVVLFFIFVLMYVALFLLMFCTIGTTLIGMGLLSVALLMSISSYLSGA
jgi:hypothetical protein